MKLTEQSLQYLRNYYIKNRKSLSKTKLKAIKSLIRKRTKENSKMAEEILDSVLYELAKIRLKQENKSLLKITKEEISQRYTDKMIEILDRGGKVLINFLKERK